MRTTRWIGGVVLATTAAMTLGAGHPETRVAIIGGTPAQRAMARWATARFGPAGLPVPPIEVRFHLSRDACHDRLGYYAGGVAHVCSLHTTWLTRRTLLHEMAHGWLEFNLSDVDRSRFLALRGLRTWNDPASPWKLRGFEQAAEIVSWALDDQGTGIFLPSVPDNSVEQLAVAYELLTGNPLPELPGVEDFEPGAGTLTSPAASSSV